MSHTPMPDTSIARFPIHDEPSVIRDATDGFFRVIRDPDLVPGWVEISDLNLGISAEDLEAGGYTGTIRVNGQFTTVLEMARLCGRYPVFG